ncbi:MAG: hypothetical protein AAB706_01465 [Patescibacteria group bacterium]
MTPPPHIHDKFLNEHPEFRLVKIYDVNHRRIEQTTNLLKKLIETPCNCIEEHKDGVGCEVTRDIMIFENSRSLTWWPLRKRH